MRQLLLVASQPFAHPVFKLHVGRVDTNAVEAPVGEVTVIRSSSYGTKNRAYLESLCMYPIKSLTSLDLLPASLGGALELAWR